MSCERVNLTVRSPVAVVEAELTRRGVRLQPSVGGRPYAVDDHFGEHAYTDIVSAADALRLCDEMDEECGGRCTKAKQIRSWLDDPFWTESADRVRAAVSVARRVCCAQHETGSMCLRGEVG